MRIPVIRGIIDRRILVNFRVDPAAIQRILPRPFRPKLVKDHAIAGVCMIRLKDVRPRGAPSFVGMTSENAAHRIAVQWEESGELREGVFVPRRDTSSRINVLLGGRLFSGVQHQAKFDVKEEGDRFRVDMRSRDDEVRLVVDGSRESQFPAGSVFESLDEASSFFEKGSVGFSPSHDKGRFDGLQLRSFRWMVESLRVSEVESSFFQDENAFPKGTTSFDCALLMRDIEHEWHEVPSLCCP